MTRKQRRLALIGGCGVVLASAVVMMLYAIGDSKVFFQNPTDLFEKNIPAGTRIRIGGLVKEGSVQRGANLQVRFEVTDGKTSIPVYYRGILPDLFREGQGVVAEGKLEPDKVVDADTVLAKHDERYMPKEVADALKKSGRWGEGEEAAAKENVGAKTQ